MKLGIIIDSSAGISKKQIEDKKWGFLPLNIQIENKLYSDGIDMDIETYYKNINIDNDVKTSTTPLGLIKNLIKEMLKENDYILIYAISENLSSQVQNINLIAKKYTNVFVVPSKSIGYVIVKNCEKIEKLFNDGMSWEKIKKHAIELTDSQKGMLIPKTLKWLVKGGRINSKIVAMANMFKIIPLIAFENGKLKKHGKARIFHKAVLKAAKFLFIKNKKSNFDFLIYHAKNENIEMHQNNIEKIINKKTEIHLFPPVIANHLGPGAIGVIVYLK